MMGGPPNTQTGRGLLLFAAFLIILALWQTFATQQWINAGMFFALGVLFGCYGAILNDYLPRWHKVLLGIGLVAGVTAFVFALRSAGIV